MAGHDHEGRGADPVEAARILEERARRLAMAASEDFFPIRCVYGKPPGFDVLLFSLAGMRFALETRFVKCVDSLRDLALIPCTPPFVLGVVGMRGVVVSVMDPGIFLGLSTPRKDAEGPAKLVVAHGPDPAAPEVELGLAVEAIFGVRFVPEAAVARDIPALSGANARFALGAAEDGDTTMVILDGETLFADPRILVLEHVEG